MTSMIIDTFELSSKNKAPSWGLVELAERVGLSEVTILSAVLNFVIYGKAKDLVDLDVLRSIDGRIQKTLPVIESWLTSHRLTIREFFESLLEHKHTVIHHLNMKDDFVHVFLKPDGKEDTFPELGNPLAFKRQYNSFSVHSMTLRARGLILKNPNLLIPWYISASIAYYEFDESLLTDHYYDAMVKELAEKWDTLTHRHKSLLDREALNAGTGYYLKYAEMPLIIRSATVALINELKES